MQFLLTTDLVGSGRCGRVDTDFLLFRSTLFSIPLVKGIGTKMTEENIRETIDEVTLLLPEDKIQVKYGFLVKLFGFT